MSSRPLAPHIAATATNASGCSKDMVRASKPRFLSFSLPLLAHLEQSVSTTEVITEDFMQEVCPVWALVLGAAGR